VPSSTGLLSSAQDGLDPAVLRLPHALRGLHQRTALAKALHLDRGTRPAYKQHHDQIGSEHGWPPIARADFEREADHGSLYTGVPETVARKIAATVRTLGLSRFDLKYSHGRLSHGRMMRSIELYGRRPIPMVRDLLVS